MFHPNHHENLPMEEKTSGRRAEDKFGSGPCSSTSSATDDPEAAVNTNRSASSDERVDFDGLNDPENPLNWPSRKKLAIVINVALLSALGQMASSMLAPAAGQVIAEFKSTNMTTAVLVVSIFLVGMAAGLLLTSGVSEVHGRCAVIHVTNALFVVFGVAAALSRSLGQLVGFRLLQGVAAAAPPAIGGGVIGDMFVPCERGRATAMYGFGLLLGPIIGPIGGGYISQCLGWRWVCWVISITGALSLFGTMLVFRETYRPLILERKARGLQRESADNTLFTGIPHQKSVCRVLGNSIIRPMKYLILSPTVALSAFGLAVILGIMFLMLSTMSTAYQQIYRWPEGASGLPYLGLGAGLFTGLAVYSFTADRAYFQSTKGSKPPPEARLAPISLGSPLCAVGLVIYGWAFEKQLHWMIPVVGCVVFSWATVTFMMPVTAYLIDVFHAEAAGPIGASAVLRCLAGGLLPLCAHNLYNHLGYGWGNTLLAFLALAFTPFPYMFYRNGERLRGGRQTFH